MIKRIIAGVVTCSIITTHANSQGCSDAGFCSIHSIKNNTEKTDRDDKNNEISAGFVFGKGERFVSYYTWEVEYTRNISQRTSATAKLGYSFISGELAKTNGPGDLFLSVNHAYDMKGKWQKSFIIGLKIPFDKADIVEKGIHLPMPYQTSLGTTDLVLGLNFIRNSFGATIAVQQPLKPINENMFLPENYPSQPLAHRYLPSNSFSRRGDILLRLSYNIELGRKVSLRPSLLGIYHEANDSYVDANKIRRELAKSSGLTANANVFLGYRLESGSEFELTLGTPFAVRVNRPDGLTRSFVAAVNYKFNF